MLDKYLQGMVEDGRQLVFASAKDTHHTRVSNGERDSVNHNEQSFESSNNSAIVAVQDSFSQKQFTGI